MHLFFRYITLFLLLFAISCERSEPPTAKQGSPKETPLSTAIIKRLELTIKRPWSVSALAATSDRLALVAAISHSKGLLEVWSVAKDRSWQSLSKGDVGFHPDGVYWTDWDGDGSPTELLVAAEGSKEIHLWQFADNELTQLANIMVDASPQTVRATDLDSDGKPDIIFGPYEGRQVTLLFNEGDFTFTPLYLEAMPTPVYPKLADWDNDGITDIIWSDWQTGSLRWARNQGERNFTVVVLREAGSGSPREVELGDINGDTITDMVVAFETGKSAWVMFNDGKGGIADVRKLSAPGEGYTSAAISSQEVGLLALGNVVKIVLAKQLDRWQLRELGAASLPQDMQFTDVDGDGIEDLIYANSAGDEIVIVFGPVWEQGRELSLPESDE